MTLRKALALVVLLSSLTLASLALAAQGSFQSPYGQQQQLPAPSSPYPDMNAPSPYGGNQPQQQQGNRPQQQGGYQQQQQQGYQPQPQGGYQQAPSAGQPSVPLNDVLGQFKLSLNQGVMPMAANYTFALPNLNAQVTIMSVAQAQAFAGQRQQFMAMIPQMGGRITDQRQINVNGQQADLVAVTMNNPQANQQFLAYNVFMANSNLWIQVMGPTQAQSQVQQALTAVLQGLQTK